MVMFNMSKVWLAFTFITTTGCRSYGDQPMAFKSKYFLNSLSYNVSYYFKYLISPTDCGSPLPTNISREVPRSGSPNWRSWGADGVAPVSKSAGVRPRESQCFSCSLKAARLTSQLGQSSRSFLSQAGHLLFCSGLQCVGWGQSCWGGPSAVLSLQIHA